MQADLLAQVAADHVGAVADAVRVLLRLRVEQDARRVDAAGADDRRPCASTCCSAPVWRSKYCTPFARPLSSTRMRADDGVRADLELAGLERERQQVIGGAEERRRVAAGAAVAAVVARREAARRLASCWRGGRRRSECRAVPRAFCSSRSPQRGAGGGCRNLLPGSESGIVVAAADADQLFDLVVVRRDVRVGDRPGNLPAVALGRLEVHLASSAG